MERGVRRNATCLVVMMACLMSVALAFKMVLPPFSPDARCTPTAPARPLRNGICRLSAVRTTASSPPMTAASAISLLTQAADSRTVRGPEVKEAMEFLESLKGSRGAKRPALRSVTSTTWKIVWSSILKGEGYMPSAIRETVSVRGGEKGEGDVIRIDNTAAGLFSLGSVVGSYTWDAPKNTLHFAFDKFELGPLRLSIPPKPKTYNFFHLDDKVACARSSTGGVTLMRAVGGP